MRKTTLRYTSSLALLPEELPLLPGEPVGLLPLTTLVDVDLEVRVLLALLKDLQIRPLKPIDLIL